MHFRRIRSNHEPGAICLKACDPGVYLLDLEQRTGATLESAAWSRDQFNKASTDREGKLQQLILAFRLLRSINWVPEVTVHNAKPTCSVGLQLKISQVRQPCLNMNITWTQGSIGEHWEEDKSDTRIWGAWVILWSSSIWKILKSTVVVFNLLTS